MTEQATTAPKTLTLRCPYCGLQHPAMHCPRVRAIDYFPDGVTIRRVEFHREMREDR